MKLFVLCILIDNVSVNKGVYVSEELAHKEMELIENKNIPYHIEEFKLVKE